MAVRHIGLCKRDCNHVFGVSLFALRMAFRSQSTNIHKSFQHTKYYLVYHIFKLQSKFQLLIPCCLIRFNLAALLQQGVDFSPRFLFKRFTLD